jgi:D-cysteine desulfhydrase
MLRIYAFLWSIASAFNLTSQEVHPLLEYMPATFEQKQEIVQWSSVENPFKLVHATHYDAQHVTLFQKFPGLISTIPYISLGFMPTPLMCADNLALHLGIKKLYIKRDDALGGHTPQHRLPSGNKVRKLEFLLADALSWGCTHVITCGAAGSNHVLATAGYSYHLGLKCTGMLTPQYNSTMVQRNLLRHLMFSTTQLEYFPSARERDEYIRNICASEYSYTKRLSYFIPTGGSIPLGVVGFVNGGLELAQQLEAYHIAPPDYLYVPAGTVGTMAGLVLGLKAAGISTRVRAVVVAPVVKKSTFIERIIKLITATNIYLHERDSSFPLYTITEDDFDVIYTQSGQEYGKSTSESEHACAITSHFTSLALDNTYSGKAMAAIIKDINQLEDKSVIFWNTFDGYTWPEEPDWSESNYTQSLWYKNYTLMPESLHVYFERK